MKNTTGFVISWNKGGVVCMTFRNVKENVYGTREEARDALEMYAPDLRRIYPALAPSLCVREVPITEHGEAVGTVF